MRERQLRRRLTDIGLGYRFTIDELAAALAQERGRPIRLRAATLPDGGLTGGLLVTLTVDFVAYPDTSPLHRDHIICHELGHLLAGHEPVPVQGDDALQLLAPDIDPAVIRRMLSRTHYSDAEEMEAELIAGWLAHRLQPTTSPRELTIPKGLDPRIRVLLDALSPQDE